MIGQQNPNNKNTDKAPVVSPFVVTASRMVWSCPWYAVRQDDLLLPDGTAGVYNVVTKGAAVWIVPVTAAGEVVLIHNYRHTLGTWCWEIPAGGIKVDQTPLQAAQAELYEEIGGQAADWHFLLKAATMNGLGDEVGHFYLATGVMLGEAHPEPTEVLTIHRFPLAEALDMARTGQINDAQSVLALLMAAPLLADPLSADLADGAGDNESEGD